MGPEQVLEQIEAWLRDNPPPDAASLSRIREAMDDYAFLAALRTRLRSENNIEMKDRILRRIVALMRTTGDLAAARRIHSDIYGRAGIGAGASLMVASVAAAIHAPFISLIVAPGALWMAWTFYAAGLKLNTEAELYRNISDRLGKILEAIHAK